MKITLHSLVALLYLQQLIYIVEGGVLIMKTEEMDIRTIRTRKLIMDSLMELLKKKSFESIRISDITNQAEINRATFYNYFTDKYHLLETITTEVLLLNFHTELAKENFSLELIKKIYLTLTDFHTSMSNICKKNYEEMAINTNEILRETIKNSLFLSLKNKYLEQDQENLKTFSSVLSWSIFGLAYEWKLTDTISPELFFEKFENNFKTLILEFK